MHRGLESMADSLDVVAVRIAHECPMGRAMMCSHSGRTVVGARRRLSPPVEGTDGGAVSPRQRREDRNQDPGAQRRHTCRSTIIFLIPAIAFAGFSPFGHALEQFKIVWQR
jgi:hypothetical protein